MATRSRSARVLELDCSAGRIIKITMPGDWTFADIKFQTSSDGVGFNDIMRPDGREVMCTVFEGTAIIGMELVTGFIKIRSGTRDRPVPQEAIRTFAIAIDTGVAGALADTFTLRHKFGDGP